MKIEYEQIKMHISRTTCMAWYLNTLRSSGPLEIAPIINDIEVDAYLIAFEG